MKLVFNDKDKRIEKTALFFAIEHKEIDLAKYLLSKPGIDVNAKLIVNDNIRQSGCEIKCFQNEGEKVEYESSDRSEITPLYMAVDKEDVEMVKLLLERPEIDVNKNSIIEKNKITITSLVPSAPLLKMAKSYFKIT